MRQDAGFSFIELIVIMAIVSILALASGVFYGRFYNRVAVQYTVNGIVDELRKAQIYAMQGRQYGNWGVHSGAAQITLFQGGTYAGRNSAFDENFSLFPTATVSGFPDIIFSRMTGTPSALSTITVSSGSIQQTITINSLGRVSR